MGSFRPKFKTSTPRYGNSAVSTSFMAGRLAFRSAGFDTRMRDGWRIARRKGIGKLAIELVLPVLARGFLLWFFVSFGLCVWGHGSLAFRRQAASERTRSATVPSAPL